MAKVVYFLGAGLTKSLERPGHRLPLMSDFVSVMADHVDDDVIVTTLLTFDSEGIYDWRSPEAETAAEALGKEGQDYSVNNREALRTALKNRPSESIEKLLEKAESRSTSRLGWRFKNAINRLFYVIGWNVNLSPLERFLAKQFESGVDIHTFVSFNYDLLLEKAAERTQSVAWDVEAAYGIRIEPYFPDGRFKIPAPAGAPSTGNPIRILKPHGSLNWLVPTKLPIMSGALGHDFENGPVIVPLNRNGEIQYWGKLDVFSHVQLRNEYFHDVEVCIVPPVSVAKRAGPTFLQEIREQEKRAIEEAHEVYVIGWSVPETDYDQARLISCSVEARREEISRLTVVNYDAPPEYYERAAHLFGVKQSSMRIFNGGFSHFVDQQTGMRTGLTGC